MPVVEVCFQASGRRARQLDATLGIKNQSSNAVKTFRRTASAFGWTNRCKAAVFVTCLMLIGNDTCNAEEMSAPVVGIPDSIVRFNEAMDRTVTLKLRHTYLMATTPEPVVAALYEDEGEYLSRMIRLAFLKQSGNGYALVSEHVSYGGYEFHPLHGLEPRGLFVKFYQYAATAYYARNSIFFLDRTGSIHEADLVNTTECSLPPLTLDDPGEAEGFLYTLVGVGLEFKYFIYLSGDSPKSPSGGTATGTIDIVTDPYGMLHAKVKNCKIDR